MGYKDSEFIDAFDQNIQVQVEEAISANSIATAIVKFMENRDNWEGTATDLLAELETVAAELKINTNQKSWPKAPNTLSRRLNEVKTNLREIGITIDKCFIGDKGKARGIKVCKDTVGTVGTVGKPVR